MSRSTWLHLRIPFSVFLLPIFLFGLSFAATPLSAEALRLFVLLHLFLFPASNGYNSYYDRDEGPIGGLAHPPEVKKELLVWAWIFDAIALALSIGLPLAATGFVALYGTISKLYSHPRFRWKASPWLSFAAVVLLQGVGIFLFVAKTLAPQRDWMSLLPGAALSGLFMAAAYPISQIYQHREDRERGDRTLSLCLGIRGTFVFCAALFIVFNGLFAYWTPTAVRTQTMLVMQIAFLPAAAYLVVWAARAWRDPSVVDHAHTMRVNGLFAVGALVFFSWLGFARG